MAVKFTQHASSFRDPSGFIFKSEGKLYRQVNMAFKKDFDLFINSGGYTHFVKNNWLIPHTVITENKTGTDNWYQTLLPEKVPFISYPYEWSFDMLKDAALLTLGLLKEAIQFGLVLKDASPFNVQFIGSRPVFIDTLSFETYNEEQPWIAYRQFCECFLSPLLLSHYSKQPLQKILLAFPEGIPLAITSSLLPKKSRFSLHTYLHIHLHAGISVTQKKKKDQPTFFSKKKLLNLADSLETLTQKLSVGKQSTTWSNYYEEASTRKNYLQHKKEIIANWLSDLPGLATGADIGGNDGEFARLLAANNINVIATDFDATCINNLYLQLKKEKAETILPLIIDSANPTPAIGLNNEERDRFVDRLQVDICLGLALIHHLSIGKNIPFIQVARFFNQLTNYLMIEFVPKNDDKVKLMLKQKTDRYEHYTIENFEKAFAAFFNIKEKKEINDSGRTLFLMQRIEK